jgi:A/G-specific adenine glycosylase
MLQQTQVAAVIPYYTRFLERFPDVVALAAAPAADVMAAWAGLGYYSRARNLHRCAQEIVERHASRFPRTAAGLAELPGVGRSTAAAIAAFAFGERAAILDGNVKRVLARHFAVDGFPGSAAVERRLWLLAEEQLPAGGIENYTQGLMDLRATLCVWASPRCGDCPLASSCVALAERRVSELPTPRPRKTRPVRHATVAIVRDGRGAFLQGNFDHPLGNDGAGEGCAEQILALIYGPRLQCGPDEVRHELLFQILDVYLACARPYGLFIEWGEFLALAHVRGHRDDLTVIVLFEPRDNDGRIQPAGISEDDFLF